MGLAFPTVLGWVLVILPAVTIVVLTIIVAWIVGILTGRVLGRSNPQVSRAIRQIAVALVWVIGATLTLQSLGVSPDVILLVITLAAIGTVVALREPLGNVGAKYFSDIYTPFKLGDRIRVLGYEGKVIEINPMSTVLLSDQEQLISVPNSALVREVVVNTTPQAWKELTIAISLGSSTDLPRFESDLLKSFSKLRVRLDPRFPPVLSTRARSPQSTDLTLTLMLRQPEDRDAMTAEANKRVAEVLERTRGSHRAPREGARVQPARSEQAH
jgi:small conductance mechanosensitive channel